MPYTFQLSTTSPLAYTSFLTSTSHPSLPFTASIYRDVVRNVLKKHKRLPNRSKESNLTTVLCALEQYALYLFALDAGLSGRAVSDEEIEITLVKEIEVEWRTSLAGTLPGCDAPRVLGRGLAYETLFVLTTLAHVFTLLAQLQLRMLYCSNIPATEQRTVIISTATKYLLKANSIHTHLVTLFDDIAVLPSVIESNPSVQGALAALALAESTLLAVLKDDPYPALATQDRNKNDNEWKFKAPEIPKVRAHLGARLCLAAAEHAEKAEAMLNALGDIGSKKVDGKLLTYIADLRRTARAKACRLFGISAELGGETGLGIAWLLAGKKELGFAGSYEEGSKLKGLAKLKKEWTEKKEDKKIEKGGEWGNDAGRLEEARIIDMLEKKWTKMNDMVRWYKYLDLNSNLTFCTDLRPNYPFAGFTLSLCPIWPGYPYNPGLCCPQSRRRCDRANARPARC